MESHLTGAHLNYAIINTNQLCDKRGITEIINLSKINKNENASSKKFEERNPITSTSVGYEGKIWGNRIKKYVGIGVNQNVIIRGQIRKALSILVGAPT